MRPRRRQAQRPRERRLHPPPPHVLRDAGQLLLRRLLQARSHRLTPGSWSPRISGFPKDRLYVTIFREDDEAEELWRKVAGVPKDRIFRCDEKDNFWQMGETGPCGPCSEIHYDLGAGHRRPGPRARAVPASDAGGRYVEIWNLVFMQYDRDADGKLTPLPRPSIDTGMGLERVAAILQGKLSNYDCDLILPIVGRAGELLGVELWRERRGRRGAAHRRRPCPRRRFPDPRRHRAGQRRPRLRAAQDHAPRHAPRPPRRGAEDRSSTS